MENVAGKNEVQSSSKSSKDADQKRLHQKREQGLMTKLGKTDLLKLLSIMEGEVEARDVCITNLQAQLKRDSHTKERYFQHSISDPFLALMRDNEACSGNVTPSTENTAKKTLNKDGMPIYIEPLPLLEKVVEECNRQQVKVNQHLAMNNACHKLVKSELLELKRKYARDTATGDDVTAALEKEREKLQIEIRAERAKTRKIEVKYNNLLQRINEETQTFQMISTMLLEERKVRKSNFDIKDDTPLEQFKLQFKEVSIRNKELETLVRNMKINEASMKQEIQTLQQQLKSAAQSFPTAVKNGKEVSSVKKENETHLSKNVVTPLSTAPSASTDNSRVVSVKRTSSVIEKRCVKAGERQSVGSGTRATPLSKSFDSSEMSDNNRGRYVLHLEDKKVSANKERGLQIATNIVSSPTSGAANFALNSPNQPPPHSAFSSSLTVSKGQKPTSAPSGSFQATRQKFQRYTKPKPSLPVSSLRNHTNEATAATQSRQPKSNAETSPANAFPSVQAGGKTEGKVNSTKKLSESGNGYKPQPPKPAKNLASKPAKEEKSDPPRQACPPPVPPKKPSIIQKSNSVKVSAVRAMGDHEAPKKTGLRSGDKTSRITSKPSPTAANKLTNHSTTSKTNLKRPTSLGTNNSNNNNNNNKNLSRLSIAGDHTGTSSLITQPVPPSSAPARLLLSAQQRLFPPQDGSSGQLLSPVTNTVPKSPLGPTMFKF